MNEMLNQLSASLPSWAQNRFLHAGTIALMSVAAAKLFDMLICRVALRMTAKTKTDVDDQLIMIMHRPLFASVLLIGLYIAMLRLRPPAGLFSFCSSIMQTVAIITWLAFGFQLTNLLLSFFAQHPGRLKLIQTRTLPLFKNIALVVLFGAAVYFIFLAWNINVTAWLASAGIIGIALGFAAKDSLANLFAGVFILVDAPYKLGDFVVLDSGERGQVTHIGIRSTRLLTRDDIEITIPNAIMGNTKIINETGGPHKKERIRVKVGIAYGSDIDKARETLTRIAQSHQEVCDRPEPKVRFRSFGDSGLNLELLCWVREPVLRGRLLDAINTEVYKAFAQSGIEIPYPKRDIYVKQMPDRIDYQN